MGDLYLCYLKCGGCASNLSVTWKLVRNVGTQAPSQTYSLRVCVWSRFSEDCVYVKVWQAPACTTVVKSAGLSWLASAEGKQVLESSIQHESHSTSILLSILASRCPFPGFYLLTLKIFYNNMYITGFLWGFILAFIQITLTWCL